MAKKSTINYPLIITLILISILFLSSIGFALTDEVNIPLEEGEEPIDTAYKELSEEVGVKKEQVSLIKKLNPVEFTDIYDGKSYDWTVHPFLFKIEKKSKLQIDWEHSEYRWIPPSEIVKYDTVPHFTEVVSKLLL